MFLVSVITEPLTHDQMARNTGIWCLFWLLKPKLTPQQSKSETTVADQQVK
jgi:hypothetical protein